uniref:GTP-binding nuclear protein Ran, testis-specific isoform-like n=1 Tax=Drosophila rhopaloa TaxID=1041015 RepID=A0A6P4DY73_DRORH
MGVCKNGYYFHAKCAIVMFDLSVESSAISVVQWLRQLEDICGPEIPVVICGNKADLMPMPLNLLYRRRSRLDYCEISARAAWNLDEPLSLLCRRLLNKSNLVLISQPILKPLPGCVLDEQKIRRRVKDIRKNALSEKDGEVRLRTATKGQRIVLN